jgi:hypothetical protein
MTERAEITPGRHAAGDDDGVHPIVAAALYARPAAGGPRHGQATADTAGSEGGLGWPGEPADGTGLGWPVDQPTGTAAEGSAVVIAPPVRRRGWRRRLGSAAA